MCLGGVLFDPLQELPKRGRRRHDLQAGEIEASESLVNHPQAHLDDPAGSRDALGPLISRVRASPLAQSIGRDLLFAQRDDLPAGGFQVRHDRPFERLDEPLDRLQQAVDARLPAQLLKLS